MASDFGDIGLLKWVIGGVAAAGVTAIGWVARAQTENHKSVVGKLDVQLDTVKREYVRRDELALSFARFDKSLDDLLEEMRLLRPKVIALGEDVAHIKGIMDRRQLT